LDERLSPAVLVKPEEESGKERKKPRPDRASLMAAAAKAGAAVLP